MQGYQRSLRTLLIPFGICAALELSSAFAEAAPQIDPQIKQAVEAFVTAGDGQSVDAVRASTHPQFRIAYVMDGKPDVTLLDRETFLGMVEQGQVGGDRRRVVIRHLEYHGNLAVARVRLEGKKAVFEGSMTLVRDRNRWRVFQDAVHMSPRT